ncbi:MAG: hypothetical protein AB2687_08015 [Candidatus Thiodiazotropha taylori]
MNDELLHLAESFITTMERGQICEDRYFSAVNPYILKKEEELHGREIRVSGEKYLLQLDKDSIFSGISFPITSHKNLLKRGALYVKQVNTLKDRFFLEDYYQEYYERLSSRKEEFQKWLDRQPAYNEALRKFRKKNIFKIVDYGYSPRDVEPLPLEVFLDKIAAKAIVIWHFISSDSIENYQELPLQELTRISEKSSELLRVIESSDYPIEDGLNSYFMKKLRELSHGVAEDSNKYMHIDREIVRYRVRRRHTKARREILIRKIVSHYMWNFGRLKVVNNIKPSESKTYKTIIRQFQNALCDDVKEGLGIIVAKKMPTIHADVIVNLLGIIEDFSDDDVTERKVQEIASKQRDRDSEYIYPWLACR